MHKSQAELMLGKKVLVTTYDWFYGHDGISYKAVYGDLVSIESDKDVLGVKTNAKSANWYIQVGRMLVAGCQVHYAINCDGLEVDLLHSDREVDHSGGTITNKVGSRIYNASF